MKLIDNWRAVLTRAWSVRLIVLAGLLSGGEVMMGMMSPGFLGLPANTFAALAGLVSAAAFLARVIAQPVTLEGEDGSLRLPRSMKGKAAAGGGLAGVIALSIALIGPWEGRELQAYRDIVGVPTICYGETLDVQIGDVATPAECETMLARRVAQFEAEIRRCLPAKLPDKTRAAFVSAAYNIGSRGFCGSSMSRRALAGDLRGACEALSLWNKAGGKVVRGLVNRRAAERALCLEGLG